MTSATGGILPGIMVEDLKLRGKRLPLGQQLLYVQGKGDKARWTFQGRTITVVVGEKAAEEYISAAEKIVKPERYPERHTGIED